MDLVVTIDTEEDNWANYSRADNSVENIRKVERLQRLFDQFAIKPTYLVTYPVATNPASAAILKSIMDEGKCEIGTHCHPWNTPPFEEDINEHNSMLCNLPESLAYKKLVALHQAIGTAFGISPVSFRAGRWGFGPSVARCIDKLGYRVDTSVTAYTDWTIYHGPDFSACGPEPYRFDLGEILVSRRNGQLCEIPATVGFLQPNFAFCQSVSRRFARGLYSRLHFNGILQRLRLLNKVWLSPELASGKEMIALAKRAERIGLPCLNMSFHSSSLIAGIGPFVWTTDDEGRFLEKIEKFLGFAVSAGFRSKTLGQLAEEL